jgi:amidohydrolase
MQHADVSSTETGQLAGRVRTEVDGLRPMLLELSHRIYQEPELRFAEHRAATLLSDLLSGEGFEVTKGVAGMDTAFLAEQRFGPGGPTVAVFCEYDALPGMGHACGHNIIAAAGAGAALAAARLLRAEGPASGRILVVGSPGEEGGGGKALLIEAGALEGVDVALMVHPAGFDAVSRDNLGRSSYEVTFTGRASHAAAAPEKGLNALDAATLLLVSLGLLRQQLRSDSRLHAIVAEGGESVNVIPERSRLKVFIRSPDTAYLRGRLHDAVQACVDDAALATGTQAEMVEAAPAYDPVRVNPVLAEVVGRVFTALGRRGASEPGGDRSAGSTDMGNVSQVIPSVHPYLCLTPGVALHTREFAEAAGGPLGELAVTAGAVLVGTAVAELLRRPGLVDAAAREHETTQQHQ